MESSSRDRISVDLYGLKAALVAHAQARQVGVSVLVRTAVARELGLAAECEPPHGEAPTRAALEAVDVKLSMRMAIEEARQLSAEAKAAGLSRSAYLAGLVAGITVLSVGGGLTEHLAASGQQACGAGVPIHVRYPDPRRAPAPRPGVQRTGRPAAAQGR